MLFSLKRLKCVECIRETSRPSMTQIITSKMLVSTDSKTFHIPYLKRQGLSKSELLQDFFVTDLDLSFLKQQQKQPFLELRISIFVRKIFKDW